MSEPDIESGGQNSMAEVKTSGRRLLPGKALEKCKDNNDKWKLRPFNDIFQELKQGNKTGPRILSVGKDKEAEEESYDVFARDRKCRTYMTETFKFPSHLMKDSWSKSNGFAGFMKAKKCNISWFRILIKMVEDIKRDSGTYKYYWYEMTLFIHQPDQQEDGFMTVICFDISYPKDAEINPYVFLEELCNELNNYPVDNPPDWRFIQAALLRQAIVVVDLCVWACSKAVRNLEKNRPNPKTITTDLYFLHFPRAHDLLRHVLHNAEVLKAASDTLKDWLSEYQKEQKSLWKLRMKQQQGSQHDLDLNDSPLPSACRIESLSQTFQLLNNLQSRTASNESRLRNEIQLAFNVVSQSETRTMRIISLITLLFLPATFVSTLFSMSFFSNQPPDPPPQWGSSGKIWIYFAVAGPLTVVAVVAWVWGFQGGWGFERKRQVKSS